MVLKDAINNFPPLKLRTGDWMMSRRTYDYKNTGVHFLVGGAKALDQWESFPVLGSRAELKAEEPDWWILPDQNLMALFRDNRRSGFLYRAFSTDDGRTWSLPVKTNFPDATSKFSGLRLSDGRYVLVSNPRPGKRDPLTLSISKDGMVFSKMLYLVGDRWVDYPHVIEHEGDLYIAFAGGKQSVEVLKVSLRDVDAIQMPATPWLAAAEKPNVLFIAVDDLRPNNLGCYGDKLVKTPNLDRLARRGLVFNRAYCQQALCNPSRASLLTGRRLDTLRIWDLSTHFRSTLPDAVTLPQHFKNNGYFTQNIGKIFHNFRHEVHGDPASWSVPAVMHWATHSHDKAKVATPLPPNLAKDRECECRDVPDEAYFDGRVANLAVEALGRLKAKSQPFFLAVDFSKPHSPFNAPKQYWDLYRREEVTLPKNPDWPIDAPRVAWHNGREIRGNNQRKLTPEATLEIRHGYLASISYLDAQIGKVLDELDRQQLTDRTVIVFWSDHGYHLGEKTLWAKTSNFDFDARVPLIIAKPKCKSAGQTTEALTELMDLYPTLIELCDLPRVNGLDGVSQALVLASPSATARTAALTQHPRPAYYKGAPETMGYSIRTERFRYTEWRDWKSGETVARELYDHQADPDETRNVADDSRLARDLADCAAQLQQLKPIVHPGWRERGARQWRATRRNPLSNMEPGPLPAEERSADAFL